MITYINKNYNLPVCKYRGKKEDIKYPCYVSLKLDGELTYIIKKGDKLFSVNKSKYGRYRSNYYALGEFKKLNPPDGIYLAELYWSEGRTKEDFYGLLRNKTNNELKLAIWGILQQYDKIGFTAREVYNYLSWMERDIKDKRFKYLSVAPQWWINSEEKLQELIKKYIFDKGYEGLVVKNEDAIWREGQTIKFIKIKLKDREFSQKNKNGMYGELKYKYGMWI